MLKTILQYMDIAAELEKEFKTTGGWLKKKKLDEMTGETAREKHEIQNQLQIQMKRELKK